MYVRKRSEILWLESYFTVVAIRGRTSWHANRRYWIIAGWLNRRE
jgi:hypothetical protein